MKIRKMLLPLILMVLCLVLLPSKAEAATIASGTCGDNLTWTLDDAGTLSVYGTGWMDEYYSEGFIPPWKEYAYSGATWEDNVIPIKFVRIEDGVLDIGSYAFYDCYHLVGASIPATITDIRESAFSSCGGLEFVFFKGDAPNIADDTFDGCSIICYYPENNTTWTEDVMQDYGGSITWVALENNIIDMGICGDNLIWTLDDAGSLTISGTGDSGYYLDHTVPWYSYIDQVSMVVIQDGVSGIGVATFAGHRNLTSITIPDSVTYIAMYAFSGCSSLTSITIPDSVTDIGLSAFNECRSLTSITIPDSVIWIGDAAFYYCISLTGIWVDVDNPVYSSDGSGVLFDKDKTILIQAPNMLSGSYSLPDSVTCVADGAFNMCSLTSVTIPDGVTDIGYCSFANCSGLITITISNSVTSIGDYAFFGCSSLTDVYYGGTQAQRANISIGSDNTPIGSATWHCQPALIASGTCGDNLTWTLDNAGILTISGTGAMGNYAKGTAPWYSSKDFIKTVLIGAGVTTIGDNAFYYCTNLTSVTVPDSVTGIGASAFYECWELIEITIPEGVTSIGEYAFSECSFTSITIPRGVTVIADGVFSHTFLDSITIPDGVTSIGNGAFLGSCLTSISIPDSVTSIGESAFEGCELTSIAIPDSVTYIGNRAFSHCVNLTTVTMSDAVTSIGDWTFNGCQALTDITIPTGVTSIGKEAFCGCHSLKSITIPDSVTAIGSLAFYVCDSLTSITIPASVTFIGDWVFNRCDSLTGIWVDADNPTYCSDSSGVLFNKDKTILIQAPSALSGAYHIPNSVTIIKNSAFEYCRLTSITIPDSVTSVGDVAFWNCVNLKDVYYNGTSEQWEAIAIGNYNDSLSNAVIHCRVCCAYNAQGEKQIFWTLGEAFGANSGGYIQLLSDVTESVIVSTSSYLDLNGYTLTGDITIADDATLYVFDSATANYTADNRGKIVGTITGNLAQTMNTPKDSYGHNYKYLALKEETGAWSFHRYYLTVKSVVLAPCMKGEDYEGSSINYKTVLKCNPLMSTYITEYGAQLVGDKTVYANYLENGMVLDAPVENVGITNLAGTLKTTNTLRQNLQNAQEAPQVSAYIVLSDGSMITSAPIQRWLEDCVAYACAKEDLTNIQKHALGKMYTLFDKVLDSWADTDVEPVRQYALDYFDFKNYNSMIVTTPKAGTAYNLFVYQRTLDKVLYFAGTTVDREYWLATTEDPQEAEKVYLENVDGGWRMYYLQGATKLYIDAHCTGGYYNVRLSTDPEAVYYYDTECRTMLTEIDDREWFMGNYNSYSTMQLCDMKYSGNTSDYFAYLSVSEEETPDGSTEEYTPVQVTVPQTGVGYSLYIQQSTVGETLYFAGGTANRDYYLATTADPDAAVSVYLEDVDGGWRMYYMDGATKMYIDAYYTGSYYNARLTTTPTAVYTYDTTYNTLFADISGATCYLGTYSTYTTISLSQTYHLTSGNSYAVHFALPKS